MVRLSIGEERRRDQRRRREVPSDSLRRHYPVQVQRVLLSPPLGGRPCLSWLLVAEKHEPVTHKVDITGSEPGEDEQDPEEIT